MKKKKMKKSTSSGKGENFAFSLEQKLQSFAISIIKKSFKNLFWINSCD